MCYPWNRPEVKSPFRSCKRRSDCEKLKEEEGGDGGNGDCFRHNDRRKVFTGICLAKREMKTCFAHSECSGGLQCVNQVCGDSSYLQAILDLGCQKNHVCKDLLLGDHCCFDISGGLKGWYSSEAEWGKKCCSNSQSPVIPPTGNITDQEIKKLDLRIRESFSKLQMDQLICQSLEYPLMLRLDSCTMYTTTTTTTTTQKPKQITRKETRNNNQTSSSSNLSSSFIFLLLLLSLAKS